MKTFIVILVLIVLVGCPRKHTQNLTDIDIPEFPYQNYLDSLNEGNGSLTIQNDNGFSFISDKIVYLNPKEIANRNTKIDSLADFYNAIICFNSIAYDLSTIERYASESDNFNVFAEAFEQIDFSALINADLRKSLENITKTIANSFRKGELIDNKDNSVEVFNKTLDKYYSKCFATINFIPEYNPEKVIKNYAAIHKSILKGKTDMSNHLLYKTLQESDFEKKCIYAREFAYANYKSSERDNLLLIAILDSILKNKEYSPLLPELWLIWRTTLQFILGGGSNDSGMYNLFYNNMRNTVASTYLNHLAKKSDDTLAQSKFIDLITSNITRNSACIFGNNANLDDMQLYHELLEYKGKR